MTPELTAILVNYNAGSDLRVALQSIADDVGGGAWEAVVIDNASSDGSARIAEEFAPTARVIRNGSNVGFATAVNQGIAASSAAYILIMNPDCRLERGATAGLRRELDQRPRCAIAGPRILNPDGSIQGSARGDPDMLTGLFGRTALLRRLLPASALARRNVVSPDALREGASGVEVDWLSGACMLARRTALAEVGGFDPRYFMYWEDADLCRRLRARGYHVRYVPGSTAIHRVGHSSRTARAPSIRAFHASAYLYYATHVAPRTWSPRRALARALLSARCWWTLNRTEP